MTIEEFINNKLTSTAAINDAVGGNIFPTFRDDVTPSITYDLTVDQVDGTYELSGPVHYELTIYIVAERLEDATVIGDTVIEELDRAEWTDENSEEGYRVIGCFYRNRDKSYESWASKNKRLGVVDLRFDFTVDGLTGTV